jgi:hypothetical protein
MISLLFTSLPHAGGFTFYVCSKEENIFYCGEAANISLCLLIGIYEVRLSAESSNTARNSSMALCTSFAYDRCVCCVPGNIKQLF